MNRLPGRLLAGMACEKIEAGMWRQKDVLTNREKTLRVNIEITNIARRAIGMCWQNREILG